MPLANFLEKTYNDSIIFLGHLVRCSNFLIATRKKFLKEYIIANYVLNRSKKSVVII